MTKLFKTFFSLNSISLTIFSILLAAILFLTGVPILDLIELKAYDLRFRSRGPIEPSSAVVMAVIDEKSLDTEGRWPWPRSKMADLVDIISQDGAKVIGFDIGFLEPDENSRLELIDQVAGKITTLNIKNKRLTDFIDESKKDADNDLKFAEAIRDAASSVVLGYFFHMSKEGLNYQIDQKEIDDQIEKISSSKYPLIMYKGQEPEVSPFIQAYAPESNLGILTRATDFSGYFNMIPSPDGIVRWIPLIVRCGEDIFTPLSIQCIWNYLDRPQLMVRAAGYGITGVQMGKRFIPTDENGQMLINFLGPPETFPHISTSDILHGKLKEGTFKDKIVLIGATAVGLYDLRTTPFSAVYPGMEVHATVIDNILKEEFLNKPKAAEFFDLLALIAYGALIGLLVSHVGAIKGMFSVLGLSLFHLMLARWLFIDLEIWLNIVYPLLALLLTYASVTVFRYLTEERERKKIRGAFSYYVSSSVVNEMLKHPERLKLGGDKKDLTVLFSDIRGFTTISEGLSPEELVHLLNEYLTVMTDVVFKYDGTLDKYMGDAIMAIYGAPYEQQNHPASACHSALEMMEKLKKLNEKWNSEGKKPLDIGIGINTGMMMVGNMGSDQRFDYTVMGDTVNLGSRLEGINKNYRTNIMISESTYERVKDEFVCMEVDSVRVKGKTIPVKIYQLLAHGQVAKTRGKAMFYFEKGLQLYKQQNWDEAIKLFNMVSELDKGLRVAGVYVERCLDLQFNLPPEDWDGCYTMKTK